MKKIQICFRACVALFLLSVPALAQQAEKRWAVVDLSSCFLRLKPDYESSNETQCLMGTVLEVKGEDRYWRKVDAPFYKDCWTNELALAFMDEAEKDAWVQAPKWICTAEHSHLYAEPDAGSERVSDFELGNIIRRDSGSGIDAVSGAIQGTRPRKGWVGAVTASGRKVWIPASDVQELEAWKADRVASEQTLVQTAKRFLGTPYMWGGNTVNYFDCSGFVGFVYMLCGVTLPRNAREQIECGTPVPYDFSQMRPGDLVFFGRNATAQRPRSVTHVGMYIGDGRIIHSSQRVRINSLVPGEDDYYEKECVGVRRILGKK